MRSVANQDLDAGMTWIPGGRFWMGSDLHYVEEAPSHEVHMGGFWIDRTPVTNAAFARFVASTGYTTLAEMVPDPQDYPGADPAMLVPGSLVFRPPVTRVRNLSWGDWWSFVPGASWRRPDGVHDLARDALSHPVVHVSVADVEAYAAWVGKRLPTEAEWEFAARGGLDGAEFAWGDVFMPAGQRMANTWPGEFPWLGEPGENRYGTSPVDAFAANGYGLVDMIGNVWEWTSDWWTSHHSGDAAKPCCIPRNPKVVDPAASFDPAQPGIAIPRKVLKGGSHLCAPNYCRRYRPAARHPQMVDSGTSNIGFRCAADAPARSHE